MSIINTTSSLPPEAIFGGVLEIEASLSAQAAFAADVACVLDIDADLEGGYPLETIALSLDIHASLGVLSTLAANVDCELDIEGFIYLDPHDEYGMEFVIDILPADLDPELWRPRVKIDGVEYPVISGAYSEARNGVGGTLEVELARISDKAFAVAGSSVEFGIGKKVSGVWDETTFETIMTDGEITATAFNIAGVPSSPTDGFRITAISQSASNLARTPSKTLVMYDSALQALSADDFEIVFDTEGRPYVTELMPIANMTLQDVLREIYLTRLGYSTIATNIPAAQIPVTRIDFQIGQSYNSAIAGFIGVYEPLIEEVGGVPWILDRTIALPAGFPAPRTLNAGRYNSLSISINASKLDGVYLTYPSSTRGYDYITTETDVKLLTTGTFGDPDYQETLVQKSWRVYRKSAFPTAEMRREVYQETQETTANVGIITDSRESFQFDGLCRNYQRDKSIEKRLPDLATPGNYLIQEASEVTEIRTFSPHPFQPGQQYISKVEIRESGLIMTDTANPQLGNDFEMPFDEADTKGNLQEGQTTRFGPIRTVIQRFDPQRNGMVTVDLLEIYHVKSKSVDHPSSEQPADVALNGIASEQTHTYVFADETATPTSGRIENLSAGPLPMTLAIPWARRYIARRQAGDASMQVNIERYDPSLRKGAIVQIDGRDYGSGAEDLGTYIITARTVNFGNGFVTTNLTGEQVPVTGTFAIGPSNPSVGFNYAVASSGTITFNVPVDCLSGYELKADAVATITVEARKQGDMSWTAIETTPIDLSADNGTRVTYEIRITAAAVTVLTRRIVTIHIRQS